MVIGVDPVYRRLVPLDLDLLDRRWMKLRLRWAEADLNISFGEDMAEANSIVPTERIERHILWIRGEKVMLDADLAELYGATTGALNQAVKRNMDRFPPDFLFELTAKEVENLKSQIVTSSSWGGRRRSRPYAFTEQGVAMLSSVLRSDRAVRVNVQIMRTFVKLRQMLSSNAALARKLAQLEQKYDSHFKIVFDAIRQLMADDEDRKKNRRPIGYHGER